MLLSLEPAIAALAGWALLGQETGLMRWVAIILLITASIGITQTTGGSASTDEVSGSYRRNEPPEHTSPLPLPE